VVFEIVEIPAALRKIPNEFLWQHVIVVPLSGVPNSPRNASSRLASSCAPRQLAFQPHGHRRAETGEGQT
jgi:hypothetical protein